MDFQRRVVGAAAAIGNRAALAFVYGSVFARNLSRAGARRSRMDSAMRVAGKKTSKPGGGRPPFVRRPARKPPARGVGPPFFPYILRRPRRLVPRPAQKEKQG